MTISKSKHQLAQLLIEAGVTQFPEGANWAAQDKSCRVFFYRERPERDAYEWIGLNVDPTVVGLSVKIPNWHQAVLSRDEFDQIVAETAVTGEPDDDGWIAWNGGECPVAHGVILDVKFDDGETMLGAPAGYTSDEFHRNLIDWSGTACDGTDIVAYRPHKPERVEPQYCESVTRSIPEPTATPTLDALLQDWRNADDFALRKQTEADEAAAMRDERWQAVQARAGEMGVTVGRCEPVVKSELVITDWKDLRIGDEVECMRSFAGRYEGSIGIVLETEEPGSSGEAVMCRFDDEDYWIKEWRFIRRP